MTTINVNDKLTYEQFSQEWLAEIENDELSTIEKGLRFGSKIVTHWLSVTTDDDDFVICDGSGDGGIDIAYLQRADEGTDGDEEGDTWYLIQSKYGTAFDGSDTILQEGNKAIRTLQGKTNNLSDNAQQLLMKLDLFRQQASPSDRIVFVFATTNPITQQDRETLDSIKTLGREQIMPSFDVEEVSLMTIWEALDGVDTHRLSVNVKGVFVEQSSGLLVGTVSLTDMFHFLKSYQKETGNLDQIYEKNVRQFLGNRRKINKSIAQTLNEKPEKFGLYNNGITIVVSNYSKSPDRNIVTMDDPYIVNGCQTTRTIWQVLDSRINAGGTGKNKATEQWKIRVERGGVVTKIVRSDEAEILNITRFTNSQNSVREQDFIALHSGFRTWASEMESDYNIYLEIQRGGIEARKAWEKQHPEMPSCDDYVNAFDLVKVYGAGWLCEPGLAFGKNPPFLPNGYVYDQMVSRGNTEPPFGTRDLYAAYKVKCVADQLGFGRNAVPSRRQSRFLFYHVIMDMLRNVILLTPELHQPAVPASALTDAVIKLADLDLKTQQLDVLCLDVLRNAAIALVDQYLTMGSSNSAHKEKSYTEVHGGDLNGFLKSQDLGKESHSPLLVQSLEQHNLGFASIPMQYEGNPTQREFVARALISG